MSNTRRDGNICVIKRDGDQEEVCFNKIFFRLKNLSFELDENYVDPLEITMKVMKGLYNGVTTVHVDILAAEIAATMTVDHPDYEILATRIAITNLHKETKEIFSEVINDLYNYHCKVTGVHYPIITKMHYDIIMDNAEYLNSVIVHKRDFEYNYFGFKILERSYLLKIDDKIVERPQHMLMRVAIGIHGEDIKSAVQTYHLLSKKYIIHGTSTLMAAATPDAQLSSCFMLTMYDDSSSEIYETLSKCTLVSKFAGDVGLNVHCIRANGSVNPETGGNAKGLVPILRAFNNTARCPDEGDNNRLGAFAVYLEPWHPDIFDFLNLKKNTGREEMRARFLYYGLWIPDLFMKRVEGHGLWSLMCPSECPGLHECWGEDFEELYVRYERENRFKRQIPAQQLWHAIIDAQIETGAPYMMYKDACNRKSNQQNLGTIKCSNLCTDIVEYTAPDEIAVCNHVSIALNMFVTSEKTYDFMELKEVTKIVTRNLNKIIDINYYPVPEAKNSNMRHRPIGISVQGLADTFVLMRLPYNSPEARLLNQQIFETLYYGALEASCELAEIEGPYSTYEGSPVSKGILQFEMWDATPTDLWDWDALKEKIAKYGVRNSLLLAPMPAPFAAQILGNSEAFEPIISNICSRWGLSGEFQVVSHHLMCDLIDLGLWNEQMKNEIIANCGSVESIEKIPEEMKQIYKTVWEMPKQVPIIMAAERGAFIDQSQSFNIYVDKPSFKALTTVHFYGWKVGLKTGMYALRTMPPASVIKLAVNRSEEPSDEEDDEMYN